MTEGGILPAIAGTLSLVAGSIAVAFRLVFFPGFTPVKLLPIKNSQAVANYDQ
jgi:hypothetical protein